MSTHKNLPLESKVTIKIPRILYNRLQKIVEGSGFNSVTDFVVYVLRDLVSEAVTDRRKMSASSGEDELTKEEVEAIRKRLHTLGYL
jgi:Arc/MetJ-type ribon-helix-helix transcriptional regulator